MPCLLYIDTSGKTATVALSRQGLPFLMRKHHDAREQAAVLNGMINETVAAAGLGLDAIDAICVGAGPGSYTGLRVGLSTAKGLAYALDIPLMLFNNLELLAAEYQDKGALAIALKARTGEYFYARYDAEGKEQQAPQHLFEQDIPQPEGLQLVTDEPELFPGTIARITLDPEREAHLPSWIVMAESRFTMKQFDDLAYSEPFYLKAAYTTQSKK